jgi:ABC-2 type transport system ATP-binding protein
MDPYTLRRPAGIGRPDVPSSCRVVQEPRHVGAYAPHVAIPVIDVQAVSKRYGDVVAVDKVSLRVDQGEIYALLGLNGAGKTTLIRMLLGMVGPTGGTVALFGAAVSARAYAVWSRVGYLVETPAAYPELTVRENLDLVRRWRQVADAGVVDDVLERLDLTAYAHRRARTVSLGNAQRLGLAKALLHGPELLILDEPANGLDPAGVVEVRDLLLRLAEAGTTVFLSSHVLAEVARLATRIGIIHNGRLIQELQAVDLDRRVQRWLSIGTRDDQAAARAMTAAGFTVDKHDGGLLSRDDRAVNAPDEVAAVLVSAGCPPLRLVVERDDLETYFLRAVGAFDA